MKVKNELSNVEKALFRLYNWHDMMKMNIQEYLLQGEHQRLDGQVGNLKMEQEQDQHGKSRKLLFVEERML